MKYIFGTLIVLASLLFSAPRAQAATCTNITDNTQYEDCCPPGDNQGFACLNYVKNNTPVAPSKQQVGAGSGTVSTQPVVIVTTTSSSGGLTADQKVVAACSAIKFSSLLDIAIWAKCIIAGVVIPGIFTLAFVVFLWGVFKFIRSSEQKDKQDSKQFIYVGLIGLFVMVSVWGIIRIAATTLGIESAVPTLQSTTLDMKNANKK